MFQKLAAEKGKKRKDTGHEGRRRKYGRKQAHMRLPTYCALVALGLLGRKNNRAEAFFVLLPNRPLQTCLFGPPDALFDCAVDNTTHKKNSVHAIANCASQPCFLQNKKYNRQKKSCLHKQKMEYQRSLGIIPTELSNDQLHNGAWYVEVRRVPVSKPLLRPPLLAKKHQKPGKAYHATGCVEKRGHLNSPCATRRAQ